jgi:ketosteroid isomerase-like protein
MAEFADPIGPDTLHAFNDAYARRDLAALDLLLDDDAHWLINGPVELLHFCGERRGKRAVLDMVGRIAPAQFKIITFVPETVLIDGDRASTLTRMTGERTGDGRIISYRVAQFIRFRNNKVVKYCSVIDSFDAAEQVLGRPIALGTSQPFENDALIAV